MVQSVTGMDGLGGKTDQKAHTRTVAGRGTSSIAKTDGKARETKKTNNNICEKLRDRTLPNAARASSASALRVSASTRLAGTSTGAVSHITIIYITTGHGRNGVATHVYIYSCFCASETCLECCVHVRVCCVFFRYILYLYI